MFAIEQRADLGDRRLHAFAVGAVGEVDVADVVPRAHPHAGVDRDRAHRRMRKHEAQRGPARSYQLGHDRREVVAVGAEAMQPHDRPARVRPGLGFDGFQQVDGLHAALWRRHGPRRQLRASPWPPRGASSPMRKRQTWPPRTMHSMWWMRRPVAASM
jgi:hypothetical protein